MSEMIERVARAICSDPFELYDRIKHDPTEARDQQLLVEQMERWRIMARAAIEAMLEPTEGMVSNAVSNGDYITRTEAAIAWVYMIDEALK